MIFILKNISIPSGGISWEVNETATTKKPILIRVRRKIKDVSILPVVSSMYHYRINKLYSI